MNFIIGNIYWITYSFILPPHEKISLCVCADRNLFFWINSLAKPHGVGQLPVAVGLCNALRHDSYIDLSSLKSGSEPELATARDVGEISTALKTLILTELAVPSKLLSDSHRKLVLQNFGRPIL